MLLNSNSQTVDSNNAFAPEANTENLAQKIDNFKQLLSDVAPRKEKSSWGAFILEVTLDNTV